MCGSVVIVTRWWLAWLLASVAGVMALLAANLSPSWLLSPPPSALISLSTLENPPEVGWSDLLQDTRRAGRPCLGLWLRCSRLQGSGLHCGVYATTVPHLHPAQVAALVALVVATVAAAVTCVTASFTACVRSIKGWSCFSIISIVQAFGGVASIVSAAAFPLAWDSPRVQSLCGEDAGLYHPAACVVGWATYAAVCGGVLLLVCSCLAFRAAAATRSHQVVEQLDKGNNFVFLI